MPSNQPRSFINMEGSRNTSCLQGLANVVTLPMPEPKPVATSRNGTPHPVRRVLAEDKLETYEVVIEPEEFLAQPEGWKKISEERTSQLDWVAPKIIKRVFIRPRYVKAERFALAPLPPQPIEQGMVGPGLLAQVLVNKYEYHQPLYRQKKVFRQQFGVELSRKAMGYWVEQAAELLKRVYFCSPSRSQMHTKPAIRCCSSRYGILLVSARILRPLQSVKTSSRRSTGFSEARTAESSLWIEAARS
jgi:transposase